MKKSPESQGSAHTSAATRVFAMLKIVTVANDADFLVVRRLFGEYQRNVEAMLDGTEICP